MGLGVGVGLGGCSGEMGLGVGLGIGVGGGLGVGVGFGAPPSIEGAGVESGGGLSDEVCAKAKPGESVLKTRTTNRIRKRGKVIID